MPPIKKHFSDLISSHSNGDFDAHCSRELRKVIEAVEAGNGTGKITVTIAFKKEKRMIVSKPTVKATVPVGAVDASMFFVTAEGDLSEEDPKQVTLKFPSAGGKLVKLDGGGSDKAPSAPDDSEPKKGN